MNECGHCKDGHPKIEVDGEFFHDVQGVTWQCEDGKWFRMHYQCPNDNTVWCMEWSCTCNDRCPVCDAEIESHHEEDLSVASSTKV